ncbi:MAG: ribonuclease R [Tissierellia bacterium]|nr:ribonuclease R [Tissierellia bacterium]
MNIKELLLEIIKDKDYTPLTVKEFMAKMDIEKSMEKEFKNIIDTLLKENEIRLTSKNKIVALTKKEKSLVGKIEGNSRGFGFFVSSDEDMENVFITHEKLHGAMNNDTVRIKILEEKKEDRKAEGEVVEILERSDDPIVGTFYKSKNFGFVEADDRRFFDDIHVNKECINNANTNDKVVVKVYSYPKNKSPEGEIIEVLGRKDERKVDIFSIVSEYRIPRDFSKETHRDVLEIEKEVSTKDKYNRKDFTKLFTVTIDGIDSKDFDDAISIEKDNEDYILYVHIADVSHYVKENTPIDKDAYERGNSTYLYDVVIPMLPKELSNGICSLNPGVDRLSVTVKMKINKNGNVIENEFYRSVINSNYRLVYRDVNKYLDENDESVYEDKTLKDNLDLFNELYKILRKMRTKRGSIDFNNPESEVILDNDGDVIDIKKAHRGSGNRLIEEFMLVANETVATTFSYLDFPFIYRIHEKPDKSKLDDFKNVLNLFGYNIKGNELYPKDFQNILKEVEGKKEEPLINTIMLRTMQKAKYSADNVGHFGLSTKFYTHFTSPIRRYPDLIVHRLLKLFMDNRLTKVNQRSLEKKIEVASEHLSTTERRSESCERDVEDLQKCKFMKKHIGDKFVGIISSITSFGIFVELDNTVEGLFMYKFSEDNFNFDEFKYSVFNTDKEIEYHIGMEVSIEVIGVDFEKRKIDFMME